MTATRRCSLTTTSGSSMSSSIPSRGRSPASSTGAMPRSSIRPTISASCTATSAPPPLTSPPRLSNRRQRRRHARRARRLLRQVQRLRGPGLRHRDGAGQVRHQAHRRAGVAVPGRLVAGHGTSPSTPLAPATAPPARMTSAGCTRQRQSTTERPACDRRRAPVVHHEPQDAVRRLAGSRRAGRAPGTPGYQPAARSGSGSPSGVAVPR